MQRVNYFPSFVRNNGSKDHHGTKNAIKLQQQDQLDQRRGVWQFCYSLGTAYRSVFLGFRELCMLAGFLPHGLYMLLVTVVQRCSTWSRTNRIGLVACTPRPFSRAASAHACSRCESNDDGLSRVCQGSTRLDYPFCFVGKPEFRFGVCFQNCPNTRLWRVLDGVRLLYANHNRLWIVTAIALKTPDRSAHDQGLSHGRTAIVVYHFAV